MSKTMIIVNLALIWGSLVGTALVVRDRFSRYDKLHLAAGQCLLTLQIAEAERQGIDVNDICINIKEQAKE